MQIIPAIDILSGRCVRLEQGDTNRVREYGLHPRDVAKSWEREGATRLHVVDLDGATTGTPRNIPSIREILGAVSIPLQVGGGIRHNRIAAQYRGSGVDRVIVSTVALQNEWALRTMVRDFGEDSVVVSIDAHDGIAVTHGWRKSSGLKATELLILLADHGIKRIIYTDTRRDGTRSGPNVRETARMVERAEGLRNPIKVTAAGGVSNIEDLRLLKNTGAEGAIVGRALSEKAFRLPEAMAACA